MINFENLSIAIVLIDYFSFISDPFYKSIGADYSIFYFSIFFIE